MVECDSTILFSGKVTELSSAELCSMACTLAITARG